MLRNAKEYLQINVVQDIYIYIYTVHTYIDKRRELLMNSTLTFVGVLKATSGADDRILEES